MSTPIYPTLSQLQAFQDNAFGLFDYDASHTGKPWEDHSDDVHAGKRFRGICSDYTTTCANLCLKGGVDPKLIKLVICKDELGEQHGVCAVTIDKHTYCLDNRFPHVYDWQIRASYVWEYSMELDEAGLWRRIP